MLLGLSVLSSSILARENIYKDLQVVNKSMRDQKALQSKINLTVFCKTLNIAKKENKLNS